MKFIAFIKSLFTDIPQQINYTAWYFIRGKKKSESQLILEKLEKDKEKIEDRIINGPNINLNK